MAGWTCPDREVIEWNGTIRAKRFLGDTADTISNLSISNENKANVFDGVDDYVEIPHHASQLGANLSNGFTISVWINPRSIGEVRGRILDKSSEDGGLTGFYLSASTNQSVEVKINNGTNRNSANNSALYYKWTHILVTISSGQLVNFYSNGILSGTANQNLIQTISTITTTNVMRIGNRSGLTDRSFDGSIRSVKMWNRVLTAEEIKEDYGGKTPEKGLIHYFKLGGDYNDYGSVGVVATNSGSIVSSVYDNPILINSNINQTSGALFSNEIGTAPTVTASQASGAIYILEGALYYKSSSGSITLMGNA